MLLSLALRPIGGDGCESSHARRNSGTPGGCLVEPTGRSRRPNTGSALIPDSRHRRCGPIGALARERGRPGGGAELRGNIAGTDTRRGESFVQEMQAIQDSNDHGEGRVEKDTVLGGAVRPLQELEGGPFTTVLADPPWRFRHRSGKIAPEHRRLSRYDTLSIAQLQDLRVPEIVTPDAHLYLWVPNALVAEGLELMRSWGFEYKANLIWAKRRKDGGPDGRGMGFYFRNVTEMVLFGVRGEMRTLEPGRRQVNLIETRKREHSRKPDELYDIIEACSPGPYLEMFARYARPGWVSWGREAGEDTVPRAKRYPAYS